VLVEDADGHIVDVQPDKLASALPRLVEELVETVRGQRPSEDMRGKYYDERVWDRFVALARA
jgi:hypothetical protein